MRLDLKLRWPCRAFWSGLIPKPTSETEFLPAALEIMETPPHPASHLISFCIILFLAGTVLWASLGSVDIIATASGKIVPTERTKIIQPFENGVVHAIHVQDGQHVKAGDVLIEIDTTISAAERDRLKDEYLQTALDSARLNAAANLEGDPLARFVPPEDASETQIASQKTLLLNQVDEIRAKLSGLNHQIEQNEGNKAAIKATISKLEQSLPYLEKRAGTRGTLANEGYGSKLDYLTAQQDLVEHREELQVQKGRLAEAEGAVGSFRDQRQQAENEYKHAILKDLNEVDQKKASLHEQLVQASQKYRFQTLTAPVDGTVQQLAVHTEGGVVTTAQNLMSLVPTGGHLEIEAMVSNHDIGFVHAGQEADIKVDTFNFTKYGFIRGHVMSVSHDSILREDGPSSHH